jgi:hypothetical protein
VKCVGGGNMFSAYGGIYIVCVKGTLCALVDEIMFLILVHICRY